MNFIKKYFVFNKDDNIHKSEALNDTTNDINTRRESELNNQNYKL